MIKYSSYYFTCIYCGKVIGSDTMMWAGRGKGFYHEKCAPVAQLGRGTTFKQ